MVKKGKVLIKDYKISNGKMFPDTCHNRMTIVRNNVLCTSKYSKECISKAGMWMQTCNTIT